MTNVTTLPSAADVPGSVAASRKSGADYNYSRFRAELYDFEAFDAPAAREPYRDATLWTLDGDEVRLSDYLRGRPLVLETGSVTCPMYGASVPPMQELATKYPELDFVVMYVREAHPGERVGAHADLQAKIEAARSARERHGEQRTVLVDDVAGTAHALYGSMPNSVFVIDPSGTVLYRTMWNNADEMDAILSDVAHGTHVPERDLKPRPPFTLGAAKTLLIGGWQALWDFYGGLVPLVGKHRKKGTM